MIEKYDDITSADSARYNDIVRRIDNGETISADDAAFYGAFNAAVAAAQIELQAKTDAIKAIATARSAEIAETERVAREGYNKLVDAALSRYERVRGAVSNE